MNYKINMVILGALIAGLFNIYCQNVSVNCNSKANVSMNNPTKKTLIQFILGSTRNGRLSPKIGDYLKKLAGKRDDVSIEIVDLKNFNLPFLNDEISPSKRKEITDPLVKKWSDKIKEADAFIIISPEYNGGYPGVLKNALDSLYAEWSNKPVAFVGYSGGLSGGTGAIKQLRDVVLELKMKPIDLDIKIATSWKAFDQEGSLVDKTIESRLNSIINELIK